MRRKVARWNIFHKIFYSGLILKNKLLISPAYISPRTDHPYKVTFRNAIQTYFLFFHPEDLWKQWKHLPTSIAIITEALVFQTALKATFVPSSQFLPCLLPTNVPCIPLGHLFRFCHLFCWLLLLGGFIFICSYVRLYFLLVFMLIFGRWVYLHLFAFSLCIYFFLVWACVLPLALPKFWKLYFCYI